MTVMNIRYPLEPASTIRMAAKRSLRNAMQEVRSVVWSFHSSDERHRSAPAKALPGWVSTHWPGILCCAPCKCATAIRRGARRVSEPVRPKRGSWGLLRQVPALLLVFLCATGCGQKGPLYLPGDPSTIKTDVPNQDQSQTEEDEEGKEKGSQENN